MGKSSILVLVFAMMFSLMCVHIHAYDEAEEELLMAPFWDSEIIYNESAMPYSFDGDPEKAEINLLFTPVEIISVRSATLEITYKEGEDYIFTDGKLRLTKNTKIPCQSDATLHPETGSFRDLQGRFVLWAEGDYFHKLQIAVTYRCRGNEWTGIVPDDDHNKLPKTKKLLEEKKPLNVVLFGDSISYGYNGSGCPAVNIMPQMRGWGELFASFLERRYGSDVTFFNPSIAGKDSAWGKDTVLENVVTHNPDLVLIAFGMNDQDVTAYKSNVTQIMNTVLAKNPNAEFMLVAPMHPNPEVFGPERNLPYRNALAELEKEGAVLVDVTSMHQKLLEKKSYVDMTGNNINHPNDFLIRWYAQTAFYTIAPWENLDEDLLLVKKPSVTALYNNETKAFDGIRIHADVQNYTEEDKEIGVVLSVYNGTALERIQIDKIDAKAFSIKDYDDEVSFTQEEQNGDIKVKVMLFDSMNNIKPLSECAELSFPELEFNKNFALLENGASVTASSALGGGDGINNFNTESVINGYIYSDQWGKAGGGWNDATHGEFPDSLTVSFDKAHFINCIDVYTLADDFSNKIEPTPELTFEKYGITEFTLEYHYNGTWTQIPQGHIQNNNKVFNRIKFDTVLADQIRLTIYSSVDGHSRVIEIDCMAKDD